MFCKNCGKEISDNAVVCPHCGVPTDNMSRSTSYAPAQRNTIALVGFILAILEFNVIALVLSIIGFNNSKKPEYAGDGKGLAIAGIVISCITTAIWIIVIASCSAAACAIINDPTIFPDYYY